MQKGGGEKEKCGLPECANEVARNRVQCRRHQSHQSHRVAHSRARQQSDRNAMCPQHSLQRSHCPHRQHWRSAWPSSEKRPRAGGRGRTRVPLFFHTEVSFHYFYFQNSLNHRFLIAKRINTKLISYKLN